MHLINYPSMTIVALDRSSWDFYCVLLVILAQPGGSAGFIMVPGSINGCPSIRKHSSSFPTAELYTCYLYPNRRYPIIHLNIACIQLPLWFHCAQEFSRFDKVSLEHSVVVALLQQYVTIHCFKKQPTQSSTTPTTNYQTWCTLIQVPLLMTQC